MYMACSFKKYLVKLYQIQIYFMYYALLYLIININKELKVQTPFLTAERILTAELESSILTTYYVPKIFLCIVLYKSYHYSGTILFLFYKDVHVYVSREQLHTQYTTKNSSFRTGMETPQLEISALVHTIRCEGNKVERV